MKKKSLIIVQFLLIMLLLAVFIFYNYAILHKNAVNLFSQSYTYTPQQRIPETDVMRKTDITKYITINAEVKRLFNEIDEIFLNQGVVAECEVGDIITNGKDIAETNDTANFVSGRVAEIGYQDDKQVVYIDKASNYVAYAQLHDYYISMIPMIKNGSTDVILFNNYNLLDFELSNIRYNNEDACYNLEFSFVNIDSYTYPNMKIKVRILERQYMHATYINPSIIKSITINNEAIISRYIGMKDDNLLIEDLKIKILDIVNNKVIVQDENNIGEEFIKYNIYTATDFS